jgi:AAA ATPase domain
VLVEGEAGMGKSWLLGDFARAFGGVPVFEARPGEGQLPYAVLARVIGGLHARFGAVSADWARAELARIVSSLGLAPPTRFDVLRLRQAVEHSLDAWHDAGLRVLVLDDLHFADDATLEMLPAFFARAPQRAVAWMLGVRQDELPAPMTTWQTSLDAGGLLRLRLSALAAPQVEVLLASLSFDGIEPQRLAPKRTPDALQGAALARCGAAPDSWMKERRRHRRTIGASSAGLPAGTSRLRPAIHGTELPRRK